MSAPKPSIPSGTRDFLPLQTRRRQHILQTAARVFTKYGYQPIETPALEKLSVLTGKYGEEGDQLLFKVLNSGDYLAKADAGLLAARNSAALAPQLCERALRYDLTVPFARFVVMHQHELEFPFKRYQMQPVWRADRPQKGRYREFWQCDVDVAGSTSLLHEAEFIAIYDEILSALGLTDFTIMLNHRKLLAGLAEAAGCADKFTDLCVAIDKLDKIGPDGVRQELSARGITPAQAEKLLPWFALQGTPTQVLAQLQTQVPPNALLSAAQADLHQMLAYHAVMPHFRAQLRLDLSLARGLNYYTGTIFEVRAGGVQIGSIGGGGRYDDLTGMFGKSGIPGAGISLGADRVYDVLDELGLFAQLPHSGTQVLIIRFSPDSEAEELTLLSRLRQADIAAEVYHEPARLGKQFGYADKKQIPWCLVLGDEERAAGKATLKDMQSGAQQAVDFAGIVAKLQHA
ncbi:MAG: histidine--tRNA ligase [Bacteroidetes bacterium]|nr:histidine--tRNA ligase [Bacteroidota bacterium]